MFSGIASVNSTTLSRFSRLAREQGEEALWREALPWLCAICGAKAGSVIYRPRALRFRYGDFTEDELSEINRWENNLDRSKPQKLSDRTANLGEQSKRQNLNRVIYITLGTTATTTGITLILNESGFSDSIVPVAHALASSIAQIADLATELQSSQRKLTQLNLIHEVGQAIASSLDLSEVLKETTKLVVNMLDAEGAALMLLDSERNELVFTVPVGEKEDELREQRIGINEGVAGWTVRRGQAVIVNDTQTDTRFTARLDQSIGFSTKSLLCVPLQVNARTVGVLEVVNKRNNEKFTAEDQEWVSTLATQVAIAVENAQLFAREKQRVQELLVLNEVASTLSQSLDLDLMLNMALEKIVSLVNADAGAIALVDHSSNSLIRRATCGFGANANILPQNEQIGEGFTGTIAAIGEIEVIVDLPADSRLTGEERKLLKTLQLESAVFVPIKSRGQLRGILGVLAKNRRYFTEDESALLTTIGHQIGVAVDNAQLYTNLREERDRIIAVQEKVRHELVRNLHDGPAQVLAAMIMNIEHAKYLTQTKPEAVSGELGYLEELLRQANKEVRQLLFELRPIVLETQGLIAAVDAYVEQLKKRESFEFHLKTIPSPYKLSSQASSNVFAIIQEAINNIKKHAKAKNVWIDIEAGEDELRVRIEDDGIGFNLEETTARYDERTSFGLLNMQERAQLLDGTLKWTSPRTGTQNGTTIQLNIPIERLITNTNNK